MHTQTWPVTCRKGWAATSCLDCSWTITSSLSIPLSSHSWLPSPFQLCGLAVLLVAVLEFLGGTPHMLGCVSGTIFMLGAWDEAEPAAADWNIYVSWWARSCPHQFNRFCQPSYAVSVMKESFCLFSLKNIFYWHWSLLNLLVVALPSRFCPLPHPVIFFVCHFSVQVELSCIFQ